MESDDERAETDGPTGRTSEPERAGAAMVTRELCADWDAADPLAALREQFVLPPAHVIYLDGNSLGVLPRAAVDRVRQVVEQEWGAGLIRSWNDAGWIDLPQRVGAKIARLIGAGTDEVIVADSTTINLYKALSAAMALVERDAAGRDVPARRRIVSERGGFPSDLYAAESLARAQGFELVLIGGGADTEMPAAASTHAEAPTGVRSVAGLSARATAAPHDRITAALDDQTAILLLTHVDYRTGRLHDMAAINRAAHDAGALVIWDLAHSAGAVPIALHGEAGRSARAGADDGEVGHGAGAGSAAAGYADAADFAVGCGYKFLNGGPGAPAFIWVHSRHLARLDREGWQPPLAGWMGHAAPFAFSPDYQPAAGIRRFLCGTPPVLSLAALECGVDTVLAAEAYGGLAALRRKAIALGTLFVELVESRCAGHDLVLASPRDAEARGSQIAFTHPSDGYAIVQALIARGAIGDFREPNLLRFGLPPLYTQFTDIWDAVEILAAVLETGEWRAPQFRVRAAVT